MNSLTNLMETGFDLNQILNPAFASSNSSEISKICYHCNIESNVSELFHCEHQLCSACFHPACLDSAVIGVESGGKASVFCPVCRLRENDNRIMFAEVGLDIGQENTLMSISLRPGIKKSEINLINDILGGTLNKPMSTKDQISALNRVTIINK